MSTNETPDLISAADKRKYLAALEVAIMRGVDYVSYENRQIKYRSLADMMTIRDWLRAELGIRTARPKSRNRRLVFRGFS